MTNRTNPGLDDLLPEDLLWAADGHASDVVLTAIADGERSIVPATVLSHVEGCRTCAVHLGGAALLSIHTGGELAALAREGDAAARAPFPRLAVALGLVVAVLGLVPSLLEPGGLHGVSTFAMHDLPMLASGFGTLTRRLLEPGSTVGLVLTYGAATVLVATAFAFVRLLPHKETSR